MFLTNHTFYLRFIQTMMKWFYLKSIQGPENMLFEQDPATTTFPGVHLSYYFSVFSNIFTFIPWC